MIAIRAPDTGAADALRTAHRVGLELASAQPDRSAVVLLLSEDAPEAAASVPADPRAPAPRVPILPWNLAGQSAIESVLRAAVTFEAAACALVAAADGHDLPEGVARRLLAPVLEEGFDLVCPCYASHRYEGVVTTGLVYPLTRALFGRRLRQPVADELAASRRLAEHLLGEGWESDPHAGGRLWLVTGALSAEYQVCQAWLGARPPRVEAGADLAVALARVVGLLFHEMRLHAPAWQRVKGSRLVKTFGDAAPGESPPPAPAIAPMISAYRLGHQELQRVWGAVLPPQTLLALKRLAACAEERFAVEDGLWARIVYDFAVGYHLAVMDRDLLLRSLTPLYLAWAASFVREVRDLDAAGVEVRVDALCRAFEAAKPYLISRWRWPDRFNP
ncbi:MAG TPA: hypothetical protein VFP65_25375 [Anaeromyxobacteraceae bacterium]|nr:hypothetical protein [Anaeromyxobacteraceae bacterium]